MPMKLDRSTYEATQERLTRLMSEEQLRQKRIGGKRAEGYKEGVLAAKSLLREMLKGD